MAFLRSPFSTDPPPALSDGHALVRVPEMGDYEQWSSLRQQSRAFLEPWEPLWPVNDLTRAAFRNRIRAYRRGIQDDASYPFAIFDHTSGVLVGALTLSNVRRGVAQMGTLGYWIGEPFARQGYMTSAVRLVLGHAFHHLGLHRVEAACLPHNISSIGLLLKCGFAQEGLARGYLRIAGEWRDHLLFARLAA